MRQTKSITLLSLAIALFLSTACSSGSSSSGAAAADATASSALAIEPNAATIAPSAEVQFTGVGGVAPYTFTVTSGSGTIDASSGLFVAGGSNETDLVNITDSAGTVMAASVSVSSTALSSASVVSDNLTISYDPATVYTGNTITFYVSGGTSPYTFSLNAGLGSLVNNTYTTTSTAETVQLTITDAVGDAVALYIPVLVGAGSTSTTGTSGTTSTASNAVTSIFDVQSQTTSGMCGSNNSSGSVGAYSSSGVYQGNLDFCEQVAPISSSSLVLTGLYISALGQHIASPACPSGYSFVASLPDCGGNTCSGTQSLCSTSAAPANASTYITDFYITSQNSSGAGSCSSGYTQIGTTQNCSGNSCFGTQALCVQY